MSNKSVSFYMDRELQKYMTPEAKNFFMCTWYRYMFPYIPFRSGIMASLIDVPEDKNIKLTPEQALETGLSIIKSDSRNVIHFKSPYASVQNDGNNFNFTRDLHPLAQAHWEQVAADLFGDQIVKEYKGFVKKPKER